MRIHVGHIALSFAALVTLAGCSSERPVVASTPEAVTGVKILEVRDLPVRDTFHATGTVRSFRTAPLAAAAPTDARQFAWSGHSLRGNSRCQARARRTKLAR